MQHNDHAMHIKTVFCDIDGCIFKHHGDISAILTKKCELLPGVTEAFREWCFNGYSIVLTTGRPESLRCLTEQQLNSNGLFYDILLMGLPRGQRVVINDIKPGRELNTAGCVNITRNEGLKNVNI